MNTKISEMVKAFQIFKQGRTDKWITILIPKNEFSIELMKLKMEKYIYLGYSIKQIIK